MTRIIIPYYTPELEEKFENPETYHLAIKVLTDDTIAETLKETVKTECEGIRKMVRLFYECMDSARTKSVWAVINTYETFYRRFIYSKGTIWYHFAEKFEEIMKEKFDIDLKNREYKWLNELFKPYFTEVYASKLHEVIYIPTTIIPEDIPWELRYEEEPTVYVYDKVNPYIINDNSLPCVASAYPYTLEIEGTTLIPIQMGQFMCQNTKFCEKLFLTDYFAEELEDLDIPYNS